MDEKQEPRKWYQSGIVVVAAIILLAIAAFAIRQALQPPQPRRDIQIVVDTSEAMAVKFDDTTKWDAAVEAVATVLGTTPATSEDRHALRVFGGPCSRDNTELLVPFGRGNSETILESLQLEPGKDAGVGETTLASAVVAATEDLNAVGSFEGLEKKIIVITGDADSCHPNAAQFIKDHLKEAGGGISVTYKFIALGMQDPEMRQRFIALAEDTGAEWYIADGAAALTDALERALQDRSFAPVIPIARKKESPRPDEPCRRLEMVRPTYPPEPYRMRREGDVDVQVTIDRQGNVTGANVVNTVHTGGKAHKDGGIPLLAQAAKEAVLQWKYEPCPAERSRFTVRITFRR